MNDESTKSKILKTAHKLFADKGLDGVSVRELATKCDVNVAAINYHFTNKENLYIETLVYSIEEMENSLSHLYSEHKDANVEDFSILVFNCFKENSEDLKTGFKFVLSSNHFHLVFKNRNRKINGPPGGEYFLKIIKNQIPQAADEDIEWAIRVIFTQILHKAIISCNESLCLSSDPLLSDDLIRSDLRRTVRVVLADIK